MIEAEAAGYLHRGPYADGQVVPVLTVFYALVDVDQIGLTIADYIAHMVREILDRAHARARSILDRNRDVLDDGARALLARETLETADVELLARRLRPAPPTGPRARAA